jgi:glycosyltransferase involved in cell wall biosynthesis
VVKVLYDARWIGDHGIGRFADELQKSLPGLVRYQARRRPWHPLDPAFLGVALWYQRPQLFFSPGYNSPVGWPKPFIFTLHDLNHLCVPDNSNAAKRAYYKHIVRPACHQAAFVLTVSEYSKREISAWAGVSEQKIVNVGNGAGYPFTPDGPRHEPGYPYLLYVGSHKPHKNLDRLLKAYAISDTCREVRLVMTGTPSLSLRSQIQELSLSEQVQFANLASNEALARLYRGALAFVFPSLYEGFGLPPLEAMACGIPVLTSNVCSLPEVMGNAGVLVNPLDVEAIADGIRRLVQDGELRARLRQAGLLRAKEFSWDETARKTLEVLHMAAARS